MAPRGALDTFLNDILDPRLASCKNKQNNITFCEFWWTAGGF